MIPTADDALSSEDLRKAVLVLLKPPALHYARRLRTKLDADPHCFDGREEELIADLAKLLSSAGIYWDETIIRNNVTRLVREIIVALRSVEK